MAGGQGPARIYGCRWINASTALSPPWQEGTLHMRRAPKSLTWILCCTIYWKLQQQAVTQEAAQGLQIITNELTLCAVWALWLPHSSLTPPQTSTFSSPDSEVMKMWQPSCIHSRPLWSDVADCSGLRYWLLSCLNKA